LAAFQPSDGDAAAAEVAPRKLPLATSTSMVATAMTIGDAVDREHDMDRS
jgi:hypothetical protein